ncbi:MAG: hypothetical protein KIS94_10525 [Chitinophagales bacterium]|nr:hypothetical protein [Chitinophagales bacterium]
MKKYIQHKWMVTALLSIILFTVNAQIPPDWNTGGNNINSTEWFGADNTSTIPLEIRHNANQPINIFTDNTLRARFTSGSFFSSGSTAGDGLRFFDPNPVGPGHLDLWVSSSQQTHIRWDGGGLIQSRNNRFEMCGFINGLWFNTQAGRYIFNRDSSEVGRVGTNNFWRLGLNPSNVDPIRRLEVFDATNPQFRITRTVGTMFTDFETNGNGNLLVNPSGRFVGINIGTTNPSHNLHVGGNARFTGITAATSFNSLLIGSTVAGGTGANDVEVRRLAFTGNNTDVLLGNGTWGSAASLVSANNGLMVSSGVVQLGQTTCSATGAAMLGSHRYIPRVFPKSDEGL